MSRASDTLMAVREIKRRRSTRKKKSVLTPSNLRGSTKKLRKKQNKTRKVQIFSLTALPRNKQVVSKSQVFALTPGKFPYQQTLIFSNVTFVDTQDRSRKLKVSLGSGEVKYMAPLSLRRHPLQARCSCPDFYWTWNWYDSVAHALTGPRVPPYKRKTPPPPKGMPYRNPLKVPGLCKHILVVLKSLQAKGLLK